MERNSQIFYQDIMVTDGEGNIELTYDPNNCDECKKLEGSDKPSTFYLKVTLID